MNDTLEAPVKEKVTIIRTEEEKLKGFDEGVNAILKAWNSGKKKTYIFTLIDDLMQPDPINPGRFKTPETHTVRLDGAKVNHPKKGTITIALNSDGDIWNYKREAVLKYPNNMLFFERGTYTLHSDQLYAKEIFEYLMYHPKNKQAPRRDNSVKAEFMLEDLTSNALPKDESNRYRKMALDYIYNELPAPLFDKAKWFKINTDELDYRQEQDRAFVRNKLVEVSDVDPYDFCSKWGDQKNPIKDAVQQALELKVIAMNNLKQYHFYDLAGKMIKGSMINIQKTPNPEAALVQYYADNPEELDHLVSETKVRREYADKQRALAE